MKKFELYWADNSDDAPKQTNIWEPQGENIQKLDTSSALSRVFRLLRVLP